MVTDIAMTVIAEDGLAALTFKAMSERIGYSPQAIHQWYGTRDELVRAALAPVLADLRESERQLMMRLHPRLAGEAGDGDELQ
jgi:AcrR family transcriptional regulator